MGIIKAALNTIGGSLADQWLEVIEPDSMGDQTVLTRGISLRQGDRRGQNRKGSDDTISNGSVIHVYPNQFMILVDGGKIVDFTAEEGYYTVNNSSLPSLFSGDLDDAVKETFDRFRYGGVSPTAQKVYYINLQEIKGIKFGTRTPINYFDGFYNAELFLRAHGVYSIKITNPLLFYVEAIPHDKERVEIDDINEQYLSEFLEALQAAINQMSADGVRISYVASKGRELSQYMATILDENWKQQRGIEIQSVGIASISYDEESQKLINMRNQGAMLTDPSIREGYIQGAAARGIEAAGSNPNGAAGGFIGVGMGMQAGASFLGGVSQNNFQQMQQAKSSQTPSAKETWICPKCGETGSGNFCENCGAPRPESACVWVCECGQENTGNFCGNCGKPRPASKRCAKCGYTPPAGSPAPKFCPNCGTSME